MILVILILVLVLLVSDVFKWYVLLAVFDEEAGVSPPEGRARFLRKGKRP